jgi:hypothetical protein
VKKIVNYLPEYQKYVENLKKDVYNIIGCARKSRGGKEDNQMCERLKQRSLVDNMFVSISCNASDPIVQRDEVKKKTY